MTLHTELEQRMQALSPTQLLIENESHGHGGYYPGKESHFKVVVVSSQFDGLRLVQRHQKVYGAVGDLIAPSRIHALAIHAYAPDEWTGAAPDSPDCAHQPKP